MLNHLDQAYRIYFANYEILLFPYTSFIILFLIHKHIKNRFHCQYIYYLSYAHETCAVNHCTSIYSYCSISSS